MTLEATTIIKNFQIQTQKQEEGGRLKNLEMIIEEARAEQEKIATANNNNTPRKLKNFEKAVEELREQCIVIEKEIHH